MVNATGRERMSSRGPFRFPDLSRLRLVPLAARSSKRPHGQWKNPSQKLKICVRPCRLDDREAEVQGDRHRPSIGTMFHAEPADTR
jgi:hypothetical protein